MDRARFASQFSAQFTGLAEAIDAVVMPVDGACLVEARALLDALASRVAQIEAAFVAADLPELDGAGSMATWLRHHVGLTDADARRAGLRAERLAVWSGVAEAWTRSTLTGAQVDLTVALIPTHHVDRFARTDARTSRGFEEALARLSDFVAEGADLFSSTPRPTKRKCARRWPHPRANRISP